MALILAIAAVSRRMAWLINHSEAKDRGTGRFTGRDGDREFLKPRVGPRWPWRRRRTAPSEVAPLAPPFARVRFRGSPGIEWPSHGRQDATSPAPTAGSRRRDKSGEIGECRTPGFRCHRWRARRRDERGQPRPCDRDIPPPTEIFGFGFPALRLFRPNGIRLEILVDEAPSFRFIARARPPL